MATLYNPLLFADMNFPDPNVTTEYESPEGIKYAWNGFAWEIVCGGVGMPDTSIYLKKHGHSVDDSTEEAYYYWKDGVWLSGVEEGEKGGYLELHQWQTRLWNDYGGMLIHANGAMGLKTYDGQLSIDGSWAVLVSSDEYISINAVDNSWVKSREKDVNLRAEKGSITLESKSASINATQGPLDLDGGNVTVTAGGDGTFLSSRSLRLVSTINDVILQANAGAESVERELDDTSSPKQITNKEYVDAQDQKLDDALAEEIQIRTERDALHDAEIDTLEYKLEALVGLTFRGTYEFKHDQSCEQEYQECMANCTNDARCEQDCLRDYSTCEANNVEPGFFEAVDPDGQFDHLQEIIISKNDKSNVEIDWAGVLNKDDYLEVDHVLQGQLDKTNYGLYRILEEPETKTNSSGEVVYVMKLQFLQGDGVLNEKEMYEIRGITANEGVNPEELGDFLTKADAAATYLPLIGGTLTGSLMMDGSASVKTRHLDSGNNSDLQIKRNGARRILVGSDKIIFDQVPTYSKDPSGADDLTRRKWVVDNFSTTSHTHSGYASSSHNHDSSYVKGNYTISKSGGNYYIS